MGSLRPIGIRRVSIRVGVSVSYRNIWGGGLFCRDMGGVPINGRGGLHALWGSFCPIGKFGGGPKCYRIVETPLLPIGYLWVGGGLWGFVSLWGGSVTLCPPPRTAKQSRAPPHWLRRDLRVRCVDRGFRGGRFYNCKVGVSAP